MFLMFSIAAWNIRGLNRAPKQSEVPQVVNENQLSMCAIVESDIDIATLSSICSKVFRSWDWTSNGRLCDTGCRIIIGVELDEVQKALNLDPNNMILREEEAVYVEVFNLAKLDKERFLKQKAKIEWLDVGDSNSAYFHKMVKSKNQRSRIEVIINANNQEVSGLSVPDNTVSGLAYLDMVRQVSDEEINNAMFDIGDYKAPSPDGFTSAFFKKGWDIVGSDVCKATREFFTNGRLLKEINHTFIALIPKVPTPIRVNDYRPISCCNVIYKCISKILTNRIIGGIKEVVSENLSAFISGVFKGKWGFETRGSYYSPYLFTLVMEVLTLLLKRKVSLSDSFRYHKHCEELQLINVCFADDLFIFAHGDVDSARLIMEALDEFKDTSGLVPSIPKSNVYFCNVVNHVKNSILSIMPFAEVISSMQVYWDADLVIPKGIILDIHQHIRGFLWCNGKYMREKAKVAWSDICLPKSEGGLGLHCVDTFNMALITTHIWNIVSNKESLWVQWIHTYKLKGRSVWDVPMKNDVSWGWLKLL
ncbi:hypothetical protein Tco_1348333 [Tanacetum coccineum]